MIAWKNRTLTLQLAFAALALGSVHSWAVAICCVLSVGVFALESIASFGKDRNHRKPGIFCFLAVGLVAFTALQMLPLPAPLVALISPASHEVRTSLYEARLGGVAPSWWLPVTLDVSATALGLMKVLAAGLTFIAVRQRVRTEGSKAVLWCVAVSGLIVAAVSLLHMLTGWDRVYDIYEPLHVHRVPLPAPFLNTNHLAGALGLASAVTVGLALDEKDTYKRVSLLVAAGISGGALLLTLSRGGILSFVAGQLLFIGLRVFRKFTDKGKKKSAIRKELAALPLSLGVALTAGSYVALRSIMLEFEGGDATKFKIWHDALPMIKDYWLTGSGRNTFQIAYTRYQILPDNSTFTHPENFLANWLGEWGLIVGGLLILLLVTLLVLGLLRPPRRARNAGAIVALFALMIQNFADFGLELLGILLPFMVCLAVESVRLEMWIERHLSKRLTPVLGRRSCLWLGLAASLAALVAVAAAYPYIHVHSLDSDDARLRKTDMKASSDDRFESELNSSMARHPADYHLPQLGGIRSYHTGRSDPLPLLARSLTLFPGSAVSHLYVARTMARAGRLDQALVEYMETARGRTSLVPLVADEVIEITDGFEQARRWARLPEDELLVYEALAEAYIRAKLPDEARRADVAALSVDSRAPDPLKRSIRRHIEAKMWPEATKLAHKLATVENFEATALTLEGEIEWKSGHPEKALQLFEAALEKDPKKRYLYLQIARIHSKAGDTDALFEALSLYQATAPDETARGEAILRRGDYQLKLGMDNQALSSYMEAASSIPENAGVWKAIARHHEKNGDPVAALESYRELARIEPENPVWQQKVDAIVIDAKTRAIMP